MSYPQIVDYNEAVQDPRNTFTDPTLKTGQVAVTPLGLPLALSGGFALTYTVNSGSKKYAVRCFHRAIPEVESRYAAISTKLRTLGSQFFVNFDFQSKGILVRGKNYPIVKMDWAEGETLGTYLDRNAQNSAAVAKLRRAFFELSVFLESNGVAHGDIQNENVIVANGALRLIDYDGMFVSGMREGAGSEVGHKHFQHPGRTSKDAGLSMDRFSFIVVDISLEALAIDASLHRRFREGGQAIIFKANDFLDPSTSEVFQALNGIPSLRESASKLAAVCASPVQLVPSLSDFVAGRNIPISIPKTATPASKPIAVQTYVGAFDVIDAKDFRAVLRQVGNKVELVGKIISVKEGVGKRGRGKGKPYVFINFGVWNQESVKITIWSEGLGNMSARPNSTWVGRWISATGLVEPPYDGKHYGRPYRSVGITATSDNQIIQISASNAKFRLGQGTTSGSGSKSAKAKSSNQDILKSLGSENNISVRNSQRSRTSSFIPTMRASSPAITATTAATKNEAILKTLRASQPSSTTPYQAPTYQTSRPVSNSRHAGWKVPAWVWIVGALVLLAILRHR